MESKKCCSYRWSDVSNSLSRLFGENNKEHNERRNFWIWKWIFLLIIHGHHIYIKTRNWQSIWPILTNKYNYFNSKYINAAKQIHTDMIAYIRLTDRSSLHSYYQRFSNGCCIGPNLFKLYLNEAVMIWRWRCCHMG